MQSNQGHHVALRMTPPCDFSQALSSEVGFTNFITKNRIVNKLCELHMISGTFSFWVYSPLTC